MNRQGHSTTNMRDEVVELIFQVSQKQQCALVVVTHDKTLAGRTDTTIAIEGRRKDIFLVIIV